jgi:uncharacterized protein (TIGR02246 family)
MNPDDDPVAALLEAYRAAVLAQDLDAFCHLYDPDVRAFDLWGRWCHRGLDEWRAMAADWFGSLGTERVLVGISDLEVERAGDLAIGHAFMSFRAVSAEGRELRGMSNRLTLVARRRDGAWKIVHQHTSAPADPATATLVFHR